MAEPSIVTCRELARLGIEPFAGHDPDFQTWDDSPCFCNEGLGPDDGYQPCNRPHVLRIGVQQIRICCRCWDNYSGDDGDLGEEFAAACAGRAS